MLGAAFALALPLALAPVTAVAFPFTPAPATLPPAVLLLLAALFLAPIAEAGQSRILADVGDEALDEAALLGLVDRACELGAGDALALKVQNLVWRASVAER